MTPIRGTSEDSTPVEPVIYSNDSSSASVVRVILKGLGSLPEDSESGE